ncbi:hypothetical protein [Komagataeibacter sp. FNDCR2]|uniref:hypothetical protein n=1 Tax=Komagataeibacter sp. FNDCR2 TaxID=2878682 RepID=UPI001E2DC5D0|nr:hypothetical protein [Komagataeibacter sp. FNDCR2]MCE2576588.1 hypothetical protein [Komagataeibacter sp. FNDCR2]
MSYHAGLGIIGMTVLAFGYPAAGMAQTPRSPSTLSPEKPVTTTPPSRGLTGSESKSWPSFHQDRKSHEQPEQYPSGSPPQNPEPATSGQQRTKQAAPLQ